MCKKRESGKVERVNNVGCLQSVSIIYIYIIIIIIKFLVSSLASLFSFLGVMDV